MTGFNARFDKVVCSNKLRRNTGKGTPVTAELVGMHMVKPFRAWFSYTPALGEQYGEADFPLAYVGSWAGGDNRERAHSAQRRVGPKAQPTASAPAPGSPVRASFP